MSANSEHQVILSQIPISSIENLFRSIVREEIKSQRLEELQEKLLSPSETCKLFSPNITTVTLNSWTKQGLIQDHRIGGRVYYKYSEIMDSLKTIRKYKTVSKSENKKANNERF